MEPKRAPRILGMPPFGVPCFISRWPKISEPLRSFCGTKRGVCALCGQCRADSYGGAFGRKKPAGPGQLARFTQHKPEISAKPPGSFQCVFVFHFFPLGLNPCFFFFFFFFCPTPRGSPQVCWFVCLHSEPVSACGSKAPRSRAP